jgi:conjugal transfer pilus assembly protein TraW
MKITYLHFLKSIFTLFIMVIFCISSFSYAKNVGTIGQIYTIKEVDFLDFIQSRALSMQQSGLVNKLQSDMQRHAESYRDRPTPVTGVTHAIKNKTWNFDPSIVLDHDVTSADGKLIAAQGSRVNPLMHVSLGKALLFYDAEDKKEMQWISEIDKKLQGKDKIILVNGSILKEESRLKKEIYFDQAGRLTTRFGISHVPAVVVQEGQILRVTEISL